MRGGRRPKTGRPHRCASARADETAWEVGLACGGSIDVFVQPLAADYYTATRKALDEIAPFAVVTVVKGPDELLGKAVLASESGLRWGTLGQPALDAGAAGLAH